MLSPPALRVLVLGSLALTAAACGDRALRSCRELVEQESYEAAAARCEEVSAANGDPEAGLLAARAHSALGHGDRVLAWADRLKGTSSEAGIWTLVGRVYDQRGETDLAVDAFRRDVELLRAAGNHDKAAVALYGLFYASWGASRYRDALDAARQCFEEAGLAGDRTRQARAAEALYTVLYAVGDLEGARRALDRSTELLPPDRGVGRARLLSNRGNLRIDEGRLELARRDIEQALELAGGSGDPIFFRATHLNLVQIGLRRGDLDLAERHLAEAWKHPETDGSIPTSLLYYRARVERERGRLDEAARTLRTALGQEPASDWAWDLEHELGRIEEARGDLRAAEEAYERSIRIVEEMRAELGFDDAKAWLVERKREPFEALFRLQARAGRAREALATAERAKARTFHDAFVHALRPAGADRREIWTAAADRLQALQDLLPAMSESPAASPLPIDRVLAALQGRHAVVYFETGEELWLVWVAGRQVGLRKIAATAAEIAGLASRFAAAPDDVETAVILGDLLLPPDVVPPPGGTLHVAADGELGRIPFAALRPGGRCWIEGHSVAYMPGVSLMAEMEARPSRTWSPPVVLADPRGDLPAAAAEAREVAVRLGTAAGTGAAATAGALNRASQASVLHLATHTGIGPGGPWLQLADRRLTAAAVISGRLRPRLAVLATCASALPPGRPMWGSLGSAFLAAGSEAVLASLWAVEDRTAREVVLRFYAEGGAQDPVAALARAQRAFLAAGKPPSFWAPFVLFGAERPRHSISAARKERRDHGSNQDPSLSHGGRHRLPDGGHDPARDQSFGHGFLPAPREEESVLGAGGAHRADLWQRGGEDLSGRARGADRVPAHPGREISGPEGQEMQRRGRLPPAATAGPVRDRLLGGRAGRPTRGRERDRQPGSRQEEAREAALGGEPCCIPPVCVAS